MAALDARLRALLCKCVQSEVAAVNGQEAELTLETIMFTAVNRQKILQGFDDNSTTACKMADDRGGGRHFQQTNRLRKMSTFCSPRQKQDYI